MSTTGRDGGIDSEDIVVIAAAGADVDLVHTQCKAEFNNNNKNNEQCAKPKSQNLQISQSTSSSSSAIHSAEHCIDGENENDELIDIVNDNNNSSSDELFELNDNDLCDDDDGNEGEGGDVRVSGHNNNAATDCDNNNASSNSNMSIDKSDKCNATVNETQSKQHNDKIMKPTNIDVQQRQQITKAGVNEIVCPMTPRKIFDITDDEQAKSSLISPNTGNENAANGGEYEDNDYYDPDDPDEILVQFLGETNRIAEARLAARRQARAEAREIRMRELERQQKEQEQNADRAFDMHASSGLDPLSRSRLTTTIISSSPVGAVLNSNRCGSMSSRRSSEDSLEEEGRSLRDIRHELKDMEERFRKAMIANAQLYNERASQTYQIQLLKDKLEEMEETYAQLQREFKEKSRDCNALKRNVDKLNEELKLVHGQLSERDTLIAEQGLVIVSVENADGTDAKRALVTVENAQLLGSVQGSLDVRLREFGEEKQQLLAEVHQLQEQLQQYKNQGKGRTGNALNGPSGSDEDYEAQREANKIISDYKYKLQKAEQEIASLQASLARSETQVIRYKSTAEAAEKAEAELKIERRKLQRENREANERIEELETSNSHLLKRLDKLKNAKSALLKDL